MIMSPTDSPDEANFFITKTKDLHHGYTSINKIEMTADVVASLAFQLSKTKLPKAEKGKVAKGNKFIRFMKRTALSN